MEKRKWAPKLVLNPHVGGGTWMAVRGKLFSIPYEWKKIQSKKTTTVRQKMKMATFKESLKMFGVATQARILKEVIREETGHAGTFPSSDKVAASITTDISIPAWRQILRCNPEGEHIEIRSCPEGALHDFVKGKLLSLECKAPPSSALPKDDWMD